MEALLTNPEAFGSTYEESVNRTIEEVRCRINTTDENYILGAYSPSDELVGMVGFKRETGRKLRHKGKIWGMYVTEACRKQGTGRMLMQEVISRAWELDDLLQINLTVVSTNEGAGRLYRSLGFVVYGIEKKRIAAQRAIL